MLKGETGSRKLKNRGKKVMVRKRLEMKVRSLRQLWAKRMMNFSIDEDVWAAEKEKSSMREREGEREKGHFDLFTYSPSTCLSESKCSHLGLDSLLPA